MVGAYYKMPPDKRLMVLLMGCSLLLMLFGARPRTPSTRAPRPWRLHLLDREQHPAARCLDGSQPGYWHSAGTGAGASKWVIHFSGGGCKVTAPARLP